MASIAPSGAEQQDRAVEAGRPPPGSDLLAALAGAVVAALHVTAIYFIYASVVTMVILVRSNHLDRTLTGLTERVLVALLVANAITAAAVFRRDPPEPGHAERAGALGARLVAFAAPALGAFAAMSWSDFDPLRNMETLARGWAVAVSLAVVAGAANLVRARRWAAVLADSGRRPPPRPTWQHVVLCFTPAALAADSLFVRWAHRRAARALARGRRRGLSDRS